MALETEIILTNLLGILSIHLLGIVNLHDSASALHTSDSKAFSVSEATQRACPVLEGTLHNPDRIVVVLANQLQVPNM